MYITYKCIYTYIYILIYHIILILRIPQNSKLQAIHNSTLLHLALCQASRSTQSDSLLQRHKAKGPRVLGKPCFSSASHRIGIKASTITAAKDAKVAIQRQCLVESRQEAGEARIRLFKFSQKHRISTDSG